MWRSMPVQSSGSELPVGWIEDPRPAGLQSGFALRTSTLATAGTKSRCLSHITSVVKGFVQPYLMNTKNQLFGKQEQFSSNSENHGKVMSSSIISLA